MIPITYYPVPAQRQLLVNQQRVRNKPYAKYFNGDLWLHDAVLPALMQPMSLVVEQMTTSMPCSIGRSKSGVTVSSHRAGRSAA